MLYQIVDCATSLGVAAHQDCNLAPRVAATVVPVDDVEGHLLEVLVGIEIYGVDKTDVRWEAVVVGAHMLHHILEAFHVEPGGKVAEKGVVEAYYARRAAMVGIVGGLASAYVVERGE